MTELAQILAQSQQWLWVSFAVFVRVGAVIAMAPGFGEQSIPVRVKFAVAAAFTLMVSPGVENDILMPTDLVNAFALLAPEFLTGAFFGIVLRFFVFALQIAGSIAAQSTSLSQIFGGSAGTDPQPAIGHVLVYAGLALAALMDLHVQLVLYLLQSYISVPFGVLVMPDVVTSLGVAEIGRCFTLGFRLAAPFLIASLIYNVTLGVINRAMPQLMVSFVGAPAITAGGLGLLVLSAPFMLAVWHGSLLDFFGAPFGQPK